MNLYQKLDKHRLITKILDVACQLKDDQQYSKEMAVKDLENIVDMIEDKK